MVKKTVKVAHKTDGYDRVRKGKPEHVSKYEKEITIPELNKETEEQIKKGKAKELIEKIEVNIWIDKNILNRFMDEFHDLNDVKYDGSDIITKCDNSEDILYALMYRNFGGEELNFPEQDYYQLKACYRGIGKNYQPSGQVSNIKNVR